MNVMFSGGGTGGHVYPALAIADCIRRHEPDAELSFVGTSHGIENKLVPAAGYPLYHVEIRGLRRSLSLSNLKTLYLTLTSVPKAKKLLREHRPDLVVGTGGYACYPLIRAACAMGIPAVLHESNVKPGMAVRMLESKVSRIFLNFDESRAELKNPAAAVTVGNPLRVHPGEISRADARRKLGIPQDSFFLLSLGGSMGAEPINFCMLDLMEQYGAGRPSFRHLHASGSLEWEATRTLFEQRELGRYPNLQLTEYIHDMPLQLAAADLVINRAGSMTLSELCLCGKPSILIPSPHVTDNHQYRNARVLADAGAAVLIEEKDLTVQSVIAVLDDLIQNPEKREAMADRAAARAIGDADEKIYRSMLALLHTDTRGHR